MAETAPVNPSLVERLATIAGTVEMYLPVAGTYVKIADIGIHALAAFLQREGADKDALAALDAEYKRRLAIADDPAS